VKINKPLASGAATHLIHRFIAYIVLAVRQENHDWRPKMNVSAGVSLINASPRTLSGERYVPFHAPVGGHQLLRLFQSLGEIRATTDAKVQCSGE
jgi:hypothetical protein